jgi:2-polyprenyl-6-methoxyphenol hydroxylase-like FAD-dependent oxidoreductase
MTAARTDVVIVGGGIAGGALATALARDGLGVTVLEATEEYEDRVRGESMMPWGVAEARALGIEQAMLDAGAHVASTWVPYADELAPADAVAAAIPVGSMLPEIPGSLNLRHPEACALLIGLAADAGATVVRGVRDVDVTVGSSPSVRYARGDETFELSCRLVVGADGRASVVRRELEIPLEKQDVTHHIAGLLIDGLVDVPDDHDFLAGARDYFEVGFHQGNGRARVYLVVGNSMRRRFAGHDGTQSFLDSCAVSCVPFGDALAAGTPAGPCATYPATDTWCARPFGEGAVLVGDAAGYNNPVIGQGLSIALRDVRTVRDVLRSGEWSDFSDYATERMERMRRVRLSADIVGAVFAEDADNRPARHAKFFELQESDERLVSMLAGNFTGPELYAPEMYDDQVLALVRAG